MLPGAHLFGSAYLSLFDDVLRIVFDECLQVLVCYFQEVCTGLVALPCNVRCNVAIAGVDEQILRDGRFHIEHIESGGKQMTFVECLR